MRPQHITAENCAHGARANPQSRASMRPQHITAENTRVRPMTAYLTPELQ